MNCASRLESYEKDRHEGVLRVLLSSATLELLPQEFRDTLVLKYWGLIQVKGRDEPLDVCELKFERTNASL